VGVPTLVDGAVVMVGLGAVVAVVGVAAVVVVVGVDTLGGKERELPA
jgi:hypothetical protein